MSVSDIEILARPSVSSHEAPPSNEDIALLVMANDERQTWLQVKSLGAIESTNVEHMMGNPTTLSASLAVQVLPIDPAVRLLGTPVARVALLSQQQTSSVPDDVQDDIAESRPALDLVRRFSRRQKLKKDQAEVCPICLDKMTKSQQVHTLPCFHRLHSRCSMRYFKTSGVKPVCPVCRFDMAAFD
jgi:hypothetical protein